MTLPWEAADWHEDVAAWIAETLADAGLEPAGAVEHVRKRPWAASARVPIEDGVLWFKADPPSEAFEPALTSWLAGRRPELLPEVVRIDTDRAWMLLRDAGTPLRKVITDPPDPAIWDTLLPLYAELQIELIHRDDELLALATPDKRLDTLGPGYPELLARWPAATNTPSQSEIDALVEGLGDTIPASLAHEELQDHNILLQDGRVVLIDWAEAAIEHPFCGLVNTFRGLVDRWGFEPGDERLLRLRDAYLEPWRGFAAMPELVRVFELAYPLGMLCRALTWDRLLRRSPDPGRAEFENFVPAWLEMLSDMLEGRATLGT